MNSIKNAITNIREILNLVLQRVSDNMMTSSNGNILRVTGLLCEKFTGHRWIPLTQANFTQASDAELWCFLWSAPELVVGQTMDAPVIWDAIAPIMMSL